MSTAASTRPVIRIVLVSEIRLYRDGLMEGLSRYEQLTVLCAAVSHSDAIEKTRALQPDVLILDISMPGSYEAVTELLRAAPKSKILAFAVAGDESDVIPYAEAGVSGYLPRDGTIADLVRAIESVARGEVLCSPQVVGEAFRRLAVLHSSLPAPRGETPHLTEREREIVALIDQGLSNKQIARRLYITLATVKNHVHHVLEKLNVTRRADAVAKLGSMRAHRWETARAPQDRAPG